MTINIIFDPKVGYEDKLRKVFHKYDLQFYNNLKDKGIAYIKGNETSFNRLFQQIRKEGVTFIIADDSFTLLTEHQKTNYLSYINHSK